VIAAHKACSKHRHARCAVTRHLAHRSRHKRVKLARRTASKPVQAVALTR
jgi:hypothetical protein